MLHKYYGYIDELNAFKYGNSDYLKEANMEKGTFT